MTLQKLAATLAASLKFLIPAALALGLAGASLTALADDASSAPAATDTSSAATDASAPAAPR